MPPHASHHKGWESGRAASRRQRLVNKGIVKPFEYTDSLELAWEKAGLSA